MPGRALRRIAVTLPTVLLISFVIFALLDAAPGDPMAQMPLTIPPDVRAAMREALGLDAPMLTQFGHWLWQFFVIEPLHLMDRLLGTGLAGESARVISWQTRAPVMDTVIERLPQTLWVVGLGYLIGVLIALPAGIYAAARPHSRFDRIATLLATLGFSLPTFFTGVLLIVVFSVGLGWFPSIYDTTLRVTSLDTLGQQLRQMVLPVSVIALYNAAQISRFMRAAMRDALQEGHIRTARAKGLSERAVVLGHALRGAMLPVVTVLALGAPQVFAGAIITEQVFRVNGLGQLLITAIQANDLPMVQTLTVIFALLIVAANLLADLAYGLLDPRIKAGVDRHHGRG
ncbi:ABC transporter permease [Poseidonocella sedimentorum]|uniref:Peptide/nickel transport system permease protein n=1 Tax=Poseidonocella sedimentorum TaxID=871652 RepID=A0A1I6CR26_9RHOB|nr:ABC transporter permease [Poseidonocella sedimentorum]SFQ95620.1 peptide/nickel transport system permease protein [Poseidonocella sedimentorum]